MNQGLQVLQSGDPRRAIVLFSEAILADWPNSDPSLRPYHFHRAEAYAQVGVDGPIASLEGYRIAQDLARRGEIAKSIKAYKSAIEADPHFLWASNNLAWLLATVSDSRFRNGSEAARIAIDACEASDWHCWSFIDTLAAAKAEIGEFSVAIGYSEQALEVAPVDARSQLQSNIDGYRRKRPLRRDS